VSVALVTLVWRASVVTVRLQPGTHFLLRCTIIPGVAVKLIYLALRQLVLATGHGLFQPDWSHTFFPSPRLGFFPLTVPVEEEYGAGIPGSITPVIHGSRQDEEVP